MFTSTTVRCITVTVFLPEDLRASVGEALPYKHSRTQTLDTPAVVLGKWSNPPRQVKNREKVTKRPINGVRLWWKPLGGKGETPSIGSIDPALPAD